jgi:hypothetical protein
MQTFSSRLRFVRREAEPEWVLARDAAKKLC